MTEVARTRGNSSRVERGEVAEVAALGNVLKELFNRLGISQNQYAHRVHLDKSAVSRYLGGQRLAPQEFIDRLVAEVEEHVGVPLQLPAKEALRNQRLEALRVCNPAEFELESLRGELARSRRETDRAHRNIEALHALLEKKESEVRHVADDLTRLRLDWGASQQGLLREIEQLRKDLVDAERLRADAERRSEDLREHVLRLEEELSERGPAEDVPLEAFKDRLLRMWEEENFPEVARELTEAAWARPLEEVAELLRWLVGQGAGLVTPETLVTDVGRLRPVDDVVRFAPEVARLGAELEDRSVRTGVLDAWVAALSSRVTERNVAVFYQGLKDLESPFRSQGELVLSRAVRRAGTPSQAVGLIRNAVDGSVAPVRLSFTASTVAGRLRTDETFPFLVALGLREAGLPGVASNILAHLSLGRFASRTRPTVEDVRFCEGVHHLDASARDALYAFMAELGRDRLMGRFADRLYRGGGDDLRPIDHLLDVLASRDALGLLAGKAEDGTPHISGELRRYVDERHPSRGQ
ncbi:helix-turn-helix domain-containing protein [Streptomyces lateritius]|uniref:Helix-turn-helix domain-containing protein n=1 Tax=Streptomyces lateritius TaxID=67313 RepID=A0ABW6YBK4_9ACTN